MWPFKSKKKYLILKEEYDEAKESISSWYATLVISLCVLGLFLALVLADVGPGHWPLSFVGISILVGIKSLDAVKKHKLTIAEWFEQNRNAKIEQDHREEEAREDRERENKMRKERFEREALSQSKKV